MSYSETLLKVILFFSPELLPICIRFADHYHSHVLYFTLTLQESGSLMTWGMGSGF